MNIRAGVRRISLGLALAGAALSSGVVVPTADAQSCDPAYANACVPIGTDPCDPALGYPNLACCESTLYGDPDTMPPDDWPPYDDISCTRPYDGSTSP